MNATTPQTVSTLTPNDLENLAKSYITPEIAEAAGIIRVDSVDGAAKVSAKPKRGEDHSGLIFPYRMPESTNDRIYRLRRDHPTLEKQSDGSIKETKKYLSSGYDRNDFYFSPQAKADWLKNTSIKTVFVEGEKKTLALQRYFIECHEQILVVGLAGVWNWKGRNGKAINNAGKSQATTGAINDFDHPEWKKREVEIIFDADAVNNQKVKAARTGLMRELTGRGASVRILEMPDVAQTKCKGIDDLLGEKGAEFVTNWFQTARQQADETANSIGRYFIGTDGLRWNKPTMEGGSISVLLCNFHAEITGDISEDDGAETKRCYEIVARLAGDGHERKGVIPTPDFARLAWRDEVLGARAIIHPGRERHVECAIRELSYDIQTRLVVAQTGWRNDGDGWRYYHNGGAIGANGLIEAEVKLPVQLAPFTLPAVPSGNALTEIFESVLTLLDVAPDEITIPLIGSVFAAILGNPDFSIHLHGFTGNGKSVIAALIQSFFGSGFADATKLPASWSSTANANEGVAHTVKDAILVIDDFCPTGSIADVSRLHASADRIMRAQGNHSGRGRMRADGSLRPTKPPRGLILSTGEDIPKGQSLGARMLILDLPKGETRWDVVTDCQRFARDGFFAQSTSAFIQWLATNDRIAQVQSEKNEKYQISYWREQWHGEKLNGHQRSATTLAHLSRAWHVWFEFAVAAQALAKPEAKTLLARVKKALGVAGQQQASYQSSENPATRFTELIQAAFSSNKAYLDGIDGNAPKNAESYGWRGGFPRGDRIGWIDDAGIYLIPDAAFTMAQKSGEGLTVTQSTLWKRLKEAGSLASFEDGRSTAQKRISNERKRVIHVKAEVFND